MEQDENKWDDQVKKAVWSKGRINPDYSPDILRWDRNGHVMMWSEYGRKDSKFGWGIGIIDPDPDQGKDPGKKTGRNPRDGGNNIKNLQPLNVWYENN
ncbi:MAG TPA: hypothetical protein ENO05_00820 [Bacteroides sp.]|nr:hypothetical protein [Bacteroides sp.]